MPPNELGIRSPKEAQVKAIGLRGARTLAEVKFVLQFYHDRKVNPGQSWEEMDTADRAKMCCYEAFPDFVHDMARAYYNSLYNPTTPSDVARLEQAISIGFFVLDQIISEWVNEDSEAWRQRNTIRDFSDDRRRYTDLIQWTKFCAQVTQKFPDLKPRTKDEQVALGEELKHNIYWHQEDPSGQDIDTPSQQAAFLKATIANFNQQRSERLERERQSWTPPTPEGPWHVSSGGDGGGRYFEGTHRDGGDSGGSYDSQTQRYRPGGDGGGGFDDLTKRSVEGGDGGGFEEVIPPPWEPHIPND